MFAEGLEPFASGDFPNWKYGYRDGSGSVVINPQFEYASKFSEGLASVRISAGREGYIDKRGSLVISPTFAAAWDFSGGLAAAARASQSGGDPKWGFIDKRGSFVIPPQFDDTNSFYDGLALVKVGDFYGYIRKE